MQSLVMVLAAGTIFWLTGHAQSPAKPTEVIEITTLLFVSH
jgi:hypothetical protein